VAEDLMASKVSGNPWLRIWTEPRSTIREIITTDPKFGFILLSAVYGLPLAFNIAQSFNLTYTIPFWAVIIGALVVCPFLGMIGISISTWLLQICGRLIGGKSDFLAIRAAVAWSNVPNFVTVLMWIALLSIFGEQVFSPEFTETHFIGFQAGAVFLIFLIQSVVSVWGFIILLNTLAEAQGFSIWKALLNVIIPVAIVLAIWLFAGWALARIGSINN
jgi:hypothetical protein